MRIVLGSAAGDDLVATSAGDAAVQRGSLLGLGAPANKPVKLTARAELPGKPGHNRNSPQLTGKHVRFTTGYVGGSPKVVSLVPRWRLLKLRGRAVLRVGCWIELPQAPRIRRFL